MGAPLLASRPSGWWRGRSSDRRGVGRPRIVVAALLLPLFCLRAHPVSCHCASRLHACVVLSGSSNRLPFMAAAALLPVLSPRPAQASAAGPARIHSLRSVCNFETRPPSPLQAQKYDGAPLEMCHTTLCVCVIDRAEPRSNTWPLHVLRLRVACRACAVDCC